MTFTYIFDQVHNNHLLSVCVPWTSMKNVR